MTHLPEDLEKGLSDRCERFFSGARLCLRGEANSRAATEPEPEADSESTESTPVAPWVEAVGENMVETPLFGCAMVIVGILAAAEWVRGLFRK